MTGGDRKAWAGRFAEPTHHLVESFTTSLPFDRRLYACDVAGSIAHCEMLGRQGILPKAEARKIIAALREIREEFDSGTFKTRPADEDVHMAIERRLIEKIGPTGGKLHTARSRNDQVVLDLRLYLKDETITIIEGLAAARGALSELATRHADVVMPGYTHLQPAQPVLFAHHLLAYAEMLRRDEDRFTDCLKRIDVLPLGSGALAGTTFPIDRAFVATRLGFKAISVNSMDAVSDRDFAAEFLAAAAILGMHLSRLAEDLVLWASQEFGFIELPDAFATGSSIMPQKKNPDVAELIRGKSGRLFGNLLALLTVLKGLPLRAAATRGFTLATELADYLSSKGVPFRDAHGIVGHVVRHCLANDLRLEDLAPEQLQRFSPLFGPDVRGWLSASSAVRRRRAPGGTAPDNIRRQVRRHPR
jgi:argininosuccinate lyase